MQHPTLPERQEDPRAQRSLRALMDAMIGLVETTPVHEITITRIVAAAGLTRPTFYQHFEDVPSALQLAALFRLEASVPHVANGVLDPFLHLPLDQQITMTGELVLTHLGENRQFYLAVLEAAPSTLFFDELAERVYARLLPDVFHIGNEAQSMLVDDLKYVLAGGCVWLILRWLRGDLPATPHEMASRVSRMLLEVGRQSLQFPETA
jgi:AcrR family transcriptional regulator